MRAVNVRVHRRESVAETLGHKRLRGQVVTLVKLMLGHYMKDTRITFHAGRVQGDLVHQVFNASEPVLRILHRHPANQPMDLIAQREQMLSQVTSVLSRESGDKGSFLTHKSESP